MNLATIRRVENDIIMMNHVYVAKIGLPRLKQAGDECRIAVNAIFYNPTAPESIGLDSVCADLETIESGINRCETFLNGAAISWYEREQHFQSASVYSLIPSDVIFRVRCELFLYK